MITHRLSELRKNKNMTQDELGKAFNVSGKTVGSWERGYRQPDNDTLVKIAQLFGVTTDYLLGVENIRSLDYDDIVNIPLINSLEVGEDGVTKENFERYTPFLKEDIKSCKDYFALEVQTNRLNGDGVNIGDIALIEKDADFIENKIYAVVPKGESLMLCHLSKADGIYIIAFSNPDYSPRAIVNKDDAAIIGRVVQLKREV